MNLLDILLLSLRPRSRYIQTAILVSLATGLLPGCGEQSQPGANLPEVVTLTIEPQDTPVSFEFVGKTASSRRVEIRSRVDGFLEKREYTEGSMVQAGQILFQMDRKPFEAKLKAARAELAQQTARLETATANLKRVRPLAKQNAIAQKELDDATGSYRAAAAAVEQANANVVQAELNLGYTTITSPLTGLSSFAVQREGAYLGIGTDSLLTYVAQIDPMWVEFSVSESQVLNYREKSRQGIVNMPKEGDFTVEIILGDGTVYPHTGRITFADASLSESTGTFLLRAEIENAEHTLRPGQFVRILLKGAIRPNAILIPQRAVQQGAKGSFVWVLDKDNKASFRPITVGPWHGEQWFIESGLEAGDVVVVDGALKLRPGTKVKIATPEATPGKGATASTGQAQ
ncbi:MAG: efflux RND transporter periplasmic adaptor subunit [Proteobacteria bacterium]|nr:efflux RND transporter periplasmic adaptor subunit [Pseudomonadota bacterium]